MKKFLKSLVAITVLFFLPAITHADSVTTVQKFMLKNVASGKCLDVPNGSKLNGVLIQQFDCSAGDPNQVWLLAQHADGTVVISSKQSQRSIDLPVVANARNGSKVQQWTSNGGQNQRFILSAAPHGGFQIRSAWQGSQCLDIPSQNLYQNAVKLQVYNCSGNMNQAFYLVAI